MIQKERRTTDTKYTQYTQYMQLAYGEIVLCTINIMEDAQYRHSHTIDTVFY